MENNHKTLGVTAVSRDLGRPGIPDCGLGGGVNIWLPGGRKLISGIGRRAERTDFKILVFQFRGSCVDLMIRLVG